MNRREFLNRLIEKADYDQVHQGSPSKIDLQTFSPPGTIKKMQIYHTNM